MTTRLRVFLDANILFSACYKHQSRFERLWELPGVTLLCSPYCLEEARRHLHLPEQQARLVALTARTEIVPDCAPDRMPQTVMLPAKDIPVLAAAIDSGADVLLTGDRQHFSRFFGHREAGVLVESPALFWERFERSEPSD